MDCRLKLKLKLMMKFSHAITAICMGASRQTDNPLNPSALRMERTLKWLKPIRPEITYHRLYDTLI